MLRICSVSCGIEGDGYGAPALRADSRATCSPRHDPVRESEGPGVESQIQVVVRTPPSSWTALRPMRARVSPLAVRSESPQGRLDHFASIPAVTEPLRGRAVFATNWTCAKRLGQGGPTPMAAGRGGPVPRGRRSWFRGCCQKPATAPVLPPRNPRRNSRNLLNLGRRTGHNAGVRRARRTQENR